MSFPMLRQLGKELRQLEDVLSKPPTQAVNSDKPSNVTSVQWPGAGRYWLTEPQARVARELFDAYVNGHSPEVGEARLLSVAGAKGRLSDVFKNSPAWGRLIVRGERPATYRLPDPEGLMEADPEEEVRVVPVDD